MGPPLELAEDGLERGTIGRKEAGGTVNGGVQDKPGFGLTVAGIPGRQGRGGMGWRILE